MFLTCSPIMGARQAVLLTPPNFFHPKSLLSRQQFAPLTPLAATLMNSPASVANKRLMRCLNPLDATLTKNRGVGAAPFRFGLSELCPLGGLCVNSHSLLSTFNCQLSTSSPVATHLLLESPHQPF